MVHANSFLEEEYVQTPQYGGISSPSLLDTPRRVMHNDLIGEYEEESVSANDFSAEFGNGKAFRSGTPRYHHDWASHSEMGSRFSILRGGVMHPHLSVRTISPIYIINDPMHRKSAKVISAVFMGPPKKKILPM